MIKADRNCIQQIFGALMQHPQYLSEVDKYSLSLTDFTSRFDAYIFSAISGLYLDGNVKIHPIDIENYLSSDQLAASTFEKQNGIEFLQDSEDLSDYTSFPFYYNYLKKINLLRDLQKSGFDVSSFYCEDLTKPDAYEINSRFNELSVTDIVDTLKKKILVAEKNYVKTDETETQTIAEGIEELIEGFDAQEELGLPVQGEIFTEVMGGARRGALMIRSASSGLGKALPNSALIPTPSGFKKVDEIKVGDYLFDAFGKPTRVLGVYPQGIKEVYEVTFKSGRKAHCCDEHLWSYCTSSQRKESKKQRIFYTKTLRDIIGNEAIKKDGYNILVPNTYAVKYDEKTHFIPSYLFGLALGDGSFRQHSSNKSFQFSSETEELPNKFGQMMGWIVKKNSEKNFTWYFAREERQKGTNKKVNIWVEDFLKEYPALINCKSNEKYIPLEYLEDSIKNRKDLLCGLLDTDGSVDEKGRISYTTNSIKMATDVKRLCFSLGLMARIAPDTHKDTSICYNVYITGRPEDKKDLFKLKRKKDKILRWYNSSQRKENNDFDPMVKVEDAGYKEEMTCFYVDNEEHLFLTEDYIVTHNTRQSLADAAYLAFPFRYNSITCQWERIGFSEKILFIATEQQISQIQKMVLAYITDINEDRFKYGRFSQREEKILKQAVQIMKEFEGNFLIMRIPNPTIDSIKALVRENVILHDVGYVFYDYIFIGPALLNEFKGHQLRNDELLLLMATALKDLAVELNVFVATSTQVNANADNNENIRNESSLAGGRSTINKADFGCICARPTKDELEVLKDLIDRMGGVEPNLVTDVYKVREGSWTQTRIWSKIDLGTLKKVDLFITDSKMYPVEDFSIHSEYNMVNWDEETDKGYAEKIKKLNEELA